MIPIVSIFFLANLFYLRFVPISTFWGMYFIFFKENATDGKITKNSPLPLGKYEAKMAICRKLFYQLFIVILIAISYLIALLLLLVFPIALFNYLVEEGKDTILPFLLVTVTKKDWDLFLRGELKDVFFSFLLNKLFCLKKTVSSLKIFVMLVQIGALVCVILGGIEIFNDYNSHVNPDIFDFLFPEYGAKMFWGGATVFIFTCFHLYFLTSTASIARWKNRLTESLCVSPILRNFIVSRSLLHPYFFLSPPGRFKVRNKNKSSADLTSLLKKAFTENKNIIPEEWI